MSFLWSKWIEPSALEAWRERLQRLDPTRLVVIEDERKKRIRVDYHADRWEETELMKRAFGGAAKRMDGAWMKPNAKPTLVRIRGRLIIGSTPTEELRRRFPGHAALSVPHALAFGTGEHATTALCLRMLADLAPSGPWSMLDLGTGTGVLAMAAKCFGATRVEGWENDPLALAAAASNLHINGFSPEDVQVRRKDVLAWRPRAPEWDMIVANLFAGLLTGLFPALRAALRPSGRLIISGILAEQAEECLAAGKKAGFEFAAVRQRGKWVAAHT